MKGVIFNVTEEVISRDHGADAWDALLDDAGSDGVYTSLGLYPDAQFRALVQAASARLGLPPDAVLRYVGREAAGIFAARHPDVFARYGSARAFVLDLNGFVHPEVRKLHPGADVPEFAYEESEPGLLVLRYSSRRRLCHFAHGLILGTAHHYGEAVEVTHRICMDEDADVCRLELRFS